MRHLTENAGLRPSIFARTRACAPSTTRFRRTSGVRPMLAELSSNTGNQISQFKTNLFCFSVQARNRSANVCAVDDVRHGAVDLLPHAAERRLGFTALACLCLAAPSMYRSTSPTLIDSGERASRYPPSAPRRDSTKPPCFSPERMSSRNFCGMRCRRAMSAILTGSPGRCDDEVKDRLQARTHL